MNAIGLTELVQAYLDAQYLSLTAGERALRAGHLEVVHPTRVASRRYRTVLRDLKNLFNPEVAMVLEESLRWYAGVLGGVRDLQVGRVELSRLLDKLPDNGQARQARHVVEEYLSHRERAAAVALQIALDSHRYQRMIDQLSIWHEDQPVSTDRDDADIKGYLNRARRRVRRRLEEAADAGQPEELLHDARKAAKRARYIAELAEPSLGGKAKAVAQRMIKVQDTLGARQDAAVAQELLRDLARRSANDPADRDAVRSAVALLTAAIPEDKTIPTPPDGRSEAKLGVTDPCRLTAGRQPSSEDLAGGEERG